MVMNFCLLVFKHRFFRCHAYTGSTRHFFRQFKAAYFFPHSLQSFLFALRASLGPRWNPDQLNPMSTHPSIHPSIHRDGSSFQASFPSPRPGRPN
jgi:hypothetical protein